MGVYVDPGVEVLSGIRRRREVESRDEEDVSHQESVGERSAGTLGSLNG